MDVLARIQQLMDERGWTMYRLSKESGLHIKTVCNMFNRNSMPSIPTLEAMCKAFGISVPQFFSQMEIEEVTPELKEIIRLLGPIGNNVNQMARKVNAGSSIYKEDVEEINTKLEQVYKMLIRVMRGLGKIR